MALCIIALIWLVAALSPSQASQENNGPSATDASYLSCTVWNGHRWTEPTARSARTPLMQSSSGMRAYAEVKVVIKGESCENTTTLKVAAAVGEKFKTVYTKTDNGNGMRLVGWSPNGDKLLAEVNLWEYETDRGWSHAGLIYDASSNSVKEISELDDALSRHFGPDCEFEQSIQGWKSNEQILVEVSKSPPNETYEQHFCVEHPVTFLFDLRNMTLKDYQRQALEKR